jgi:hypothetical protein
LIVGEWIQGRFEGQGTTTCNGGFSKYIGQYYRGRRDGYGKIIYASGLTFEGEIREGKPHGRGKMHSVLTKYSYEGSFER